MTRARARPTRAYDRLVRLLLQGKLADLDSELARESGLRPTERRELQAAVEFNRGELRAPPSPGLLARAAWRAWVDAPGGRAVVFGVMQLGAALVSLVGARRAVYERLRFALAPGVTHFRYTDFLQGLVHSALLHAFAPEDDVVQRHYYLGILGMMECLSGRFDSGLRSLERAHTKLNAENERANHPSLVDADLYERFQSVATVRALYLSYAGRHDDANREYERVLERTRTVARFVLIEIFIYSVRMYSDLEMLNDEGLAEAAGALRRLLGAHFRGKFALRACICISLVASLQGKSELARQQLALGEELCSDSTAAVELSRYHFLRALVHLEASETSAAMLHGRRAAGIAASLRGSRFHEADMLLLELELRLRAPLREGPLARGADDRAEIRRAFRKVRRLVKGSALIEGRLRALMLFDAFLRGDFQRIEHEYIAVCSLASRTSRRVERALREIDVHRSQKESFAMTEPDARRARELTLLDRFGRLVRSDARDNAEAAALFTFLVGAESSDVRVERGVHDERPAIEVRPTPDAIEVAVSSGDERRTFTLHRPLIELAFDVRAAELVRLAGEMLSVAMGRRQLAELQRHAAIARTTQMLAHDVRRPFGTLQAVMKAIAQARTPEAVRATADALLPEVQKASLAVSALIDDVVELGDDRAPRRERVLPELLLGQCLTEALRMPEAIDIQVDYALEHRRAWSVDPVRVPRLLANLCGNAVQALRGRGRIWVRSRDLGEGIETTVGNDGPPIAAEDLPHIFEAFFTKGKPGGTGLGLAIAHHVVTAHGGRIQCRAPSPGRGVEFVFTLPASDDVALDPREAEQLRASLPKTSKSCALVPVDESVAALRAALAPDERAAIARLGYRGRPLDVLLVDDDRAVSAGLEASLDEVAPPSMLRVAAVSGGHAAVAVARERPPELVIVGERVGLDDVRALRAAAKSAFLCVRASAIRGDSAVREATEAGADVVLTEPWSLGRALQLVAAAADHAIPVSARRQSSARPVVALVDDSRAHYADWCAALGDDAELRFYGSPSDFWAAADREPLFLGELEVVVTDYLFLDDDVDGISFARALKRRRPELAVCLSTSGVGAEEDAGDAIDVVLDKSAISWPALVERIRRHGRPPSSPTSRLTATAEGTA